MRILLLAVVLYSCTTTTERERSKITFTAAKSFYTHKNYKAMKTKVTTITAEHSNMLAGMEKYWSEIEERDNKLQVQAIAEDELRKLIEMRIFSPLQILAIVSEHIQHIKDIPENTLSKDLWDRDGSNKGHYDKDK